MADDSETGSVPNAGRPKRQPPTLELAATHVTERTVASETPPSEEPASPQDAAQGTAPDETAAQSTPHIDTAPSDMPPEPVEPVTEEPAPPPPQRERAAILLPIAAGALAGAVVAGTTWFVLNSLSVPDRSEIDALTARIAQLEARPAPKPDTSAATRIDGLEKSIAALRGDLTNAKTQSDRAVAEINQLKSAPRSTTAVVDLAPITERLNAIERAAGDLKSSTDQQNAKPADDVALRRTVAASLLDTSVRQSEPYASALAAVKPLASNATQLTPLDAFATTGVPNDATLSRELLTLLPKLAPAKTETVAAGTGFLDRLQAGAAKLVRIERSDAVSSNISAVARAGAAARSNDVTTAKRELLTLAPAERATVQPWLDKLAARDAALAASRQFAADAMAALSKPAP
ncbi:hypothetical protein RPMA_00425 [Tardiphaga alba]|uniref:Inner membrane protein n=1 Tax=Tardiphaga alba TaxID=340268 RepID=A0ABX8A4B9_9BRAD|nr:hypothetical protein [Tardiphaga alba]QUS37504.1 hypothetical protein RPMA_00425 [Tardiphaga alba]